MEKLKTLKVISALLLSGANISYILIFILLGYYSFSEYSNPYQMLFVFLPFVIVSMLISIWIIVKWKETHNTTTRVVSLFVLHSFLSFFPMSFGIIYMFLYMPV